MIGREVKIIIAENLFALASEAHNKNLLQNRRPDSYENSSKASVWREKKYDNIVLKIYWPDSYETSYETTVLHVYGKQMIQTGIFYFISSSEQSSG